MSNTSDAVMSTRVPAELKKQYSFYAKEIHRTPSSFLKEQMENFVEEQEALRSENYLKRLEESRNSKRYSAEEAKKLLGIV